MVMSGSFFYLFYVHPTYGKWKWKSNPKYPPAEKVRAEVIEMTKGMLSATLCPSLSLYLAQNGYSKAYCGVAEEYGWGYLTLSFFALVAIADFWEFFYHWCGHKFDSMWAIHRHHHKFWNPSPFAVIADEYADQFARALPLLLFPLAVPLNMDMLFFTFGVFFYAYGVYLHSGHELSYPDAHHPILNTSYQHYWHHARSSKGTPYYTGFFVKFWDKMFGSVYPGDCGCVKCEQEKGNRSEEKWAEVQKSLPDYSVLLSASFWLNGVVDGNTVEKGVDAKIAEKGVKEDEPVPWKDTGAVSADNIIGTPLGRNSSQGMRLTRSARKAQGG